MLSTTLLSFLLAASSFTAVHTRSVPENLKTFYNQVKSGSCPQVLKSGLASDTSPSGNFAYCSDPDSTVMWISGPSALADMDVDCDGANNAAGNCANDPTGQSTTAFQWMVEAYGISDLDANLHSYVVLGTDDFKPETVGISPLSVVAVVCNDQLFYGVWGDSNAARSVGEASISLATACFGDSMTGDSGHSETDVLYLAFIDKAADVTTTADWKATTFEAFEESLAAVGDAMVAKVSVEGATIERSTAAVSEVETVHVPTSVCTGCNCT